MSYPPGPTLPVPDDEEDDRPLMNGQSNGPTSPTAKLDEEEERDLVRRYEDFSTVDWIYDSLHERTVQAKGSASRHPLFSRLDAAPGIVGYFWRLLSRILEEGESWVVITLVGIGIGLTSALMAITTAWLSDMKMGYCTTGWWLSQKFCCLEISDEGEGCAEWRNWGGVEPFRWIAYILFAGSFSYSAAYLVKSFAPYAAGSGISEIKCILGGFIIKGFLSVETFLIKALTMPLAIASGLSVGKEGPSVHVACGLGNVIARLFHRYDSSHSKMREIVTAASAAGVAVAFGSPIGGVLFSIEEMNQNFSTRTMWQSFVCALVATFTLASMDPFRTGKLVLFQVSYDRDWHYFEIPAYVLIGIFGGLYGAFVMKFHLQVAAFRRKNLGQYAISEATTLAIITAFVGYLNRFLRVDMTEAMEMLFRECEGGGDREGLCQSASQWRMVNLLLLATIVRTCLIIVSYGCKVPAGIFVPSMAVGATFGRMVGILVKALRQTYPEAPWFAACQPDAPCITPGTYAFLGAAATLSGITGLTVTVAVIMFELTGALTYILPTMIVIMVTKAVSNQFGGGAGIADRLIRLNGFPFLEKESNEDHHDAFIQPIANVMKKDITIMYASGMPLQSIGEIVQSTNYQGFPVVKSEEDPTIVGFARKTELRYALEKATRTRNLSPNALCTFQITSEPAKDTGVAPPPDIVIPSSTRTRQLSAAGREDTRRVSGVEADQVDFGQYVDETPLTVSPKMPLEIVMQLFRRMGPRVILVAQEGKLVGLVTVKDLLKHEAIIHHAHSVANTPVQPTHMSRESSSSANGWGDWADFAVGGADDRGRGLEIALEEALTWVRAKGTGLVNVVYGLARRRTGAVSGGRGGEREEYGFEMAEGEEREPART